MHSMKQNVHPDYHEVTVKCACGATFKTGSTKDAIEVEICSECHPFFTGEMKYVDTMGRVERFEAKRQKAQTSEKTAQKKMKKAREANDQSGSQAQTLKEMLTTEAVKQATQSS